MLTLKPENKFWVRGINQAGSLYTKGKKTSFFGG